MRGQVAECLLVACAAGGTLPGGLQHAGGLPEVFGHGADVLVFEVGELADVARTSLAEEYVLYAVVAQQSRVEQFHLVLDVRHDASVAQHLGQCRLIDGPGVGVGVDGILVGSTKEEGFGLFPVGTCHSPLVAGCIEGCLTASDYVHFYVIV